MSGHQTIEIDGNLVGILTRDAETRSFHFHSGVAPYDLLDGSKFHKPQQAREAVARMSRAARQVRASAGFEQGGQQ